MKSSEIRKSFLDFFRSKQHTTVSSAPIVVKNDPTLMFTNAGMNQFKDIFLGNEAAKYSRVADTQKCLRVSGKHNDLEEVGYDTYHHTMFEMLGNWSFGDYFKKEAIEFAWEYLTEVVKIDKSRLYVTVFGGDDQDGLQKDNEALNFWKSHIEESRILFGSKKDNFWEMGETGPCGPCSEIHVDIRDDMEREENDGALLVNQDHPEVIEIWNLVFIEFNRLANGKLQKLPAQHVDTGMGFERLTMVLQNKKSNYDTDIFQPLIQEIAKITNSHYGQDKKKDIAMRVIADHLRAVSFTIADGQLPSNTGAGYVIRRILRRAVRYGFTFLNVEEPFVHKLLPVLVDQLSDTFPEIRQQQALVTKVIFEEEQSFLRTLSQGIKRFDAYTEQNVNLKTIDGAFAFELFDTYGFPVDLTKIMALEKGLDVDMAGFQKHLEEQKNRSRNAAAVAAGDWVIVNETSQTTRFMGYTHLEVQARIVKYREVEAKKKKHFEIVLDQTPFYAESGGQVGDLGVLVSDHEEIAIINTIKENNLIIHISAQLPEKPEMVFTAKVNSELRLRTANNHSATHLMHAALRRVLGTHVEQKGSLVDAERLRFDFSHFGKMTKEEIREVERIVNERVRADIPNETLENVPINDAKQMGAMALFGEKYGDTVRVISFDRSYSVELCGGTHVKTTGQIGLFKIVSEGAIASGVRRLEAITGEVAEQYVSDMQDKLEQIKEIVKSTGDIVKGVAQLNQQLAKVNKEIEDLLVEKANAEANSLLHKAKEIDGIKLVTEKISNASMDQLKQIAAAMRPSAERLVAVLGSVNQDKPVLCLFISDQLVTEKSWNASNLIREAAKHIQGGGGGQPGLAAAGGKNPKGLDVAINHIISHLGL
ncbi:MAG: alanine--tRNA ligase [Bacteroidales bacterium]|jgi:alanyl-tRNA synthetase|nr:alanine--tRNA ligase [Bacteroidales bacterium]